QCVDSASWQTKGGRGSMRLDVEMLYVRQRAGVHGGLEDLFRELFDALRDPRSRADDVRLTTHEYAIGSFQKLGVADSDLLEWINESLIGGSSPDGGNKESATIEDDRLILTQPAWIHAAAPDYFRLLAALRQADRGTTREEFLLAGSVV